MGKGNRGSVTDREEWGPVRTTRGEKRDGRRGNHRNPGTRGKDRRNGDR